MRRLRWFLLLILSLILSVSVFAQSDDFRVTEVLPLAGSEVSPDSVITVIFNRPVIPLGTVADLENTPDPLVITPAIEGEGEWINTSIYTFKPEPSWGGNVVYTVTVPAGFEAYDGSILAEDFTWEFSVIAPYVAEVAPLDAEGDIPLGRSLRVTFTAPVDQASFEENFVLRPIGTTENTSGTFEWNEAGDVVTFQPDDLLTIDTRYEAGFPPDSVYDAAEISTLESLFWQFATVPYPAIISTNPRDGAQNAQTYGISIQFASQMDQETLEDKITIEPEPWLEPEFYYYTWDDSLQITFPIEPSTDYTINIAPGMADIYGNTIDSPFAFSFNSAAYSPDVNLSVPGTFGFYDATREQTQVFVSHLNVSELNLSLYQVSLDSFATLALDDDYYYLADTYNPSDSSLIRRWSIESVAPLNARRYELLNLGENQATGSLCPDALPSRFNVGDTAIVIAEPDPVRARLEPVTGEIIDLLYKDYALPVIGGPECSEGITWWQVRLRDGNPAWVAEGFDGEYALDLRAEAQTTPVEVTQSGGETLDPGIYFLRVTSPETNNLGYRPQRHYMVVSNTNLVMKMNNEEALVWALDVQTGEPLANVPITMYGAGFEPIGSGVTDADGLARIDIPRITDYTSRMALLNDGTHFGMTLDDWTSGIDAWAFGAWYQFLPQQYGLYLYTDRPIYRPDQPVYFRGVLRAKDDVSYSLSDLESVPVEIYDDQGEIIYQEELPLTPYGTFSDTFMLAEDAGLGYYRISVELPSDYQWGYEGGSVSFGVAEYRLPEFQVDVTPQMDEVVQGETVTVAVDSAYFFGGKVSNANVEYNVVANPYFFNYDGPGYYDFTDYNPDNGPSEYYGSESGLIASGEGVTDAQGVFMIEIPADLQDSTQSMIFTIEATVRDESDQVVSGRTEVVVHQGEIYIGARPERYVGIAGQESTMQFIAVDWESAEVAGQEIDVEIFERRWSSVQEEDSAGRTVWTWEVEDIPIESTQVTTDDDGRAEYTFIPPQGGIYAIRISTSDAAGNVIRATSSIWVSGSQYVTWRQQNSNRIDLITDRTDYNIGDTAEILIASPFQGTAEALITVERGDVLLVERVTMDTNSYVYRLPITEDFAPNVFVSVMIVKGVDETNPVAAFRLGMVQLNVEVTRKEIMFDITPDTDQAGPGDTVTYTVRTMDYAGNPIAAEVGVGLTDLASLSIASANSVPILDFFYNLQPLGVGTSTPLTINTDQITQTVLDTIKGGGGGFGEGGIFDIREEFVDTAFWNAHLVTDADGIGTFEVTLPDNLTTWRLDARAVTMGDDGLTLVGQDTFDLLSTKPLLIRPVTPRFFVIGDQVVLAAVVNNNTNSTQSIEVALEGTGFTLADEAIQSFVVEAGSRVRVTWNVTVEDVESVDLTFFVRSEDDVFTDASKPPLGQGDARLLPVYRYEAPEIVGTGGRLNDAETITESILVDESVHQGELTLNIEPSLAAASIEALDYLRNYYHDHAEAIISRLLPNVMTLQALNRLGVDNAELETDLNRGVNYAVQRLYAYQKVDGGWGWYVNDESNALVTAYAIIGLEAARANGFVVEDSVISRAQNFIQAQLITPGLNVEAWRIDRQAFFLYSLAYSGAPDVARTVTLFENRERLSLYAKAYLILSLDIIDGNEDRIETLVSDLQNEAIVSANGTHWQEAQRDYWNWNTDTRTNALILQALVKVRPESELIPSVVRWLMVARSADAWETTQETAWAVMAFTEWMLASDELNTNYDYQISLNDESLLEGTISPENLTEAQQLQVDVAELLRDEANRLSIERGEGAGSLYYTAYLRTFLPVPEIEALNRGVIVQRRYTLLDDPDRASITEAHIGDIVQVRLTIIAPNDLHYVIIEDPIPAGTDAIDPNLITSQRIGTRPGLDSDNPLSRGWGWWWFSNIDFRDEKVVLSSTYLPAGTYEYVYTIRPGLEGVYNVMPPTALEAYFPDVFGRGEGSTFTILPAE